LKQQEHSSLVALSTDSLLITTMAPTATPRARIGSSDLTATPSPDRSTPSTPSSSFSSDKENRASHASGSEKRKQPAAPAAMSEAGLGNKRRKVSDNGLGEPSTQGRQAHERQLQEAIDTRYYDPDQSLEERRLVRRGFRELAANLNGKERSMYYLTGIPANHLSCLLCRAKSRIPPTRIYWYLHHDRKGKRAF
jgi:hypothetical protein